MLIPPAQSAVGATLDPLSLSRGWRELKWVQPAKKVTADKFNRNIFQRSASNHKTTSRTKVR